MIDILLEESKDRFIKKRPKAKILKIETNEINEVSTRRIFWKEDCYLGIFEILLIKNLELN